MATEAPFQPTRVSYIKSMCLTSTKVSPPQSQCTTPTSFVALHTKYTLITPKGMVSAELLLHYTFKVKVCCFNLHERQHKLCYSSDSLPHSLLVLAVRNECPGGGGGMQIKSVCRDQIQCVAGMLSTNCSSHCYMHQLPIISST